MHNIDTPKRAGRSVDDIAGFVRHIFAFERGRLVYLTLLSGIAAVAEGAGLLLLLPLLHLLGVTGGGGVSGEIRAILGPLGTLEGALGIYLACVIGAALIVRTRSIAAAQMRLRFVDEFRQRLHSAVLRMRWPAFQRLRSADITQTTMNEVGKAGVAIEQLASMVASGMTIPVLLWVGFSLSPMMATATIGIGALVAIASIPLDRRSSRLSRTMVQVSREVNASIVDDLQGLRVIKSFGAESAREARFRAQLTKVRAQQIELTAAMATSGAVVRATAAVVAAVGLVAAVRGFGMPIAEGVVFVLAFGRLATAGLRLQDGWRRLLQTVPGYVAAQRLLEDASAGAEPRSEGDTLAFGEAIRFDNVSIRYGEAKTLALHAITARIPYGQTTAIVGPSGAGKSTLADLLLGLAEPEQGAVFIDGTALAGQQRAVWRDMVGYVPQDAFLFHDTVRGNLQIADPEASEAMLWQALEEAAVADTVRRLPQGLDTLVGDRGTRLSGGERQRITFARALLHRPALLVLDEATSALDGESERRVLSSLQNLHGKLTMVVIAHRASTVREADHVLLLEQGRLIAQGRWDALATQAGDRLERLDFA